MGGQGMRSYKVIYRSHRSVYEKEPSFPEETLEADGYDFDEKTSTATFYVIDEDTEERRNTHTFTDVVKIESSP
jgi:hypothetical protein